MREYIQPVKAVQFFEKDFEEKTDEYKRFTIIRIKDEYCFNGDIKEGPFIISDGDYSVEYPDGHHKWFNKYDFENNFKKVTEKRQNNG
jgi:hypothetical protein